MTDPAETNSPDKGTSRLAALIENGGGLSGFAWPPAGPAYDISILKDGTWTYQGSPITRIKLCRLFATVLQRDDAGRFWLVTPGERGEITVEDAPFLAVEMAVQEMAGQQCLSFRTNLDHWVDLDANHPLRVETDPVTGQPRPYIRFRDGLDAKLSRQTFYDLVDLALEASDDPEQLGIWSGGVFFEIGGLKTETVSEAPDSARRPDSAPHPNSAPHPDGGL